MSVAFRRHSTQFYSGCSTIENASSRSTDKMQVCGCTVNSFFRRSFEAPTPEPRMYFVYTLLRYNFLQPPRYRGYSVPQLSWRASSDPGYADYSDCCKNCVDAITVLLAGEAKNVK